VEPVLALTEDAAAAVKRIVSASGLGAEAGLRITQAVHTDESGSERTDLHLSVVEVPHEGDDVLEGTRVFVDPGAADFLDDKLLDADLVEGEVRFSLVLQA
jgi:Fe-S cluster assembly iron-binding protein IscA